MGFPETYNSNGKYTMEARCTRWKVAARSESNFAFRGPGPVDETTPRFTIPQLDSAYSCLSLVRNLPRHAPTGAPVRSTYVCIRLALGAQPKVLDDKRALHDVWSLMFRVAKTSSFLYQVSSLHSLEYSSFGLSYKRSYQVVVKLKFKLFENLQIKRIPRLGINRVTMCIMQGCKAYISALNCEYDASISKRWHTKRGVVSWSKTGKTRFRPSCSVSFAMFPQDKIA